MSREDKNLKPKQKKRRVKTIVQHSRSQDTGELLGKLQTFGAGWALKLSNIATRVDELTQKIAGEVGSTWNAIHELAKSAMAHDTSMLAQDKINREVFGHLAQIDKLLDKTTTAEQRAEWLKPDEIRAEAKSWYHEVVNAAFKEVAKEREERRAAEKATADAAKLEAELKAAAEAAAAAEQKGKEEAQAVDTALRQAETPTVATQAGGEGQAAYPPGAEFFGGG